MRTSPSPSTLASRTQSSFRNRRRVLSLRPMEPKPAKETGQTDELARQVKLQQMLSNDLKRCSYLLAEPDNNLPDSSTKQTENKLWPYFQHRMELVKDKVIMEQANQCSRQFNTIRQLINRKKENHTKIIDRLTKLSKDKYREIHQRFQQIKRTNMNQLMQSMQNQKAKIWKPKDNNSQVQYLKEDIELLRAELLQIEKQLKNEKSSLDVLLTQWIALLVSISQHGFFMPQGIRPVLAQMAKYDHILQMTNFPSYIDQKTFNFILLIYKQQKTKNLNKKQEERGQIFRISRTKSSSIKVIREIAKQPQLKHIYQGARDYMANWVKNNVQKEERYPPSLTQPSQTLPTQPQVDDWQTQERRRMARVYPDKNIHDRVKNIIFGPKVEIQQRVRCLFY